MNIIDRGSPNGIVTNMLDWDIVVSSNSSCTIRFPFELMLLGKCFIPYTAAIDLIIPLLFNKDSFGIKWPTKTDMQLNKPKKDGIHMV